MAGGQLAVGPGLQKGAEARPQLAGQRQQKGDPGSRAGLDLDFMVADRARGPAIGHRIDRHFRQGKKGRCLDLENIADLAEGFALLDRDKTVACENGGRGFAPSGGGRRRQCDPFGVKRFQYRRQALRPPEHLELHPLRQLRPLALGRALEGQPAAVVLVAQPQPQAFALQRPVGRVEIAVHDPLPLAGRQAVGPDAVQVRHLRGHPTGGRGADDQLDLGFQGRPSAGCVRWHHAYLP